MITCNIRGGLGNQLFEIFTTIAYAMSCTNETFFFRNTYMLNSGVTPRHTYWHNFFKYIRGHIQNIVLKMDIVREKSFRYEELPVKTSLLQNIIFDGYFQSPKYFELYYKDIYNLLKIDELKKKITQKYNYNYKEFITMHFRLGDYKKLLKVYSLMPYEYYKNSINCMIAKLKPKSMIKILYFCEKEDNEEVNQTIIKLGEDFPMCIFIKANDQIEDWEQLLMMSCCSHNIIANSTFSWWGAYLNSNPEKIVCYPELWFEKNSKNDTTDLFPENWNKINFS